MKRNGRINDSPSSGKFQTNFKAFLGTFKNILHFFFKKIKKKPKPEDCCGSGCKVCVWKVYEKELEKYELKINAKLKKPISNGLIFTPQQIYVFFHQPIASEKNKEELSFYSNSQIEKLGWTKEEERDVQFINVPIKAMKILQCRNNEPYLLQLELNIGKKREVIQIQHR